MAQANLRSRMLIMLITLGLIFGAIFLVKMVKKLIFGYYMSHHHENITVSTAKVTMTSWPKTQRAVATLRAVQGVDVTTELAGMVQAIYFTPGRMVEAGTLLVQLKANSDIATLNALQASTALANITLIRDSGQYAAHAISKATLDADAANLKNLQAQTAAQAAIVYKKSILAPFTGRLGISMVNPGQYLMPGDKIVTLQQLDPIYADFFVPQQMLPYLQKGQTITLTVDSFPGRTFLGKVTTINPSVDVTTRNIEVEATISNADNSLLPGMFASVIVALGKPEPYLTVPATAISFNPYGSAVFIVGSDMTVTQKFVTTGEEAGDRIAVLKGLKEGDEVVTAGQIKLKNGAHVAINNAVPIPDSAAPEVNNES